MSCDQSGKKWMMKGAVLIVVIAIASWSWKTQRRIEKLEQEIATKETRFAMMQLQRELHAPSEALYYDDLNLSEELARLRMKSYANYGVTTYLPYVNVASANSHMSYGTAAGMSNEFPAVDDDEFHWHNLSDSSLEHYWMNHTVNPCLNLASQINRNEQLGSYLKQHPEQFDQHIRPLIVRLLDAYNPHVNYYACDVLLAMGDRSEELMGILSVLFSLERYKDDKEALVKRYQLNVTPYENVTLPDDTIKKRNPEWKRIHELTMKLKAKYPVVMGTNIYHWRQ
jgi:hypothetical protein